VRLLVHLSDIHFGRVEPELVTPLIQKITALKPNLVAVSGDLTQRARTYQFKEARVFLDALPRPQIVVPGNHDVPLHNLLTRFFSPLDKYRRYITSDLQPFFNDEEIAVEGINTARSLTFKGGRVNESQIRLTQERFTPLGDEITKIVVTHHPFDLPEGHDESDLVGRSRMAMEALARCGADLFLSGHLHISHIGHTAKRYNVKGHSALVVQAGTATSSRHRGEANSFNVIRIAHPEISVERLEWLPESLEFVVRSEERFRHNPDGWVREK
jgi:3',5'-cyclic AMP phosphodiesterase CpdA